MKFENAHIITLIIITCIHNAITLEVTICECDSLSLVGLLDMSTLEYCKTKQANKIIEIAYDEINLIHEPLVAKGFLCKKWINNLTVMGHWDGFCEEKRKQSPIDISSTECLIMSEELSSANQKMKAEGRTAIYDAEPIGKCHWLSTDQYFNYNCHLEVYNVTQDCPTCPIKSPYGILQENPRDDVKGTRRGHTTLAWQKPKTPINYECQYHVTRKGRAMLMDAGNPTQQHIRDKEN